MQGLFDQVSEATASIQQLFSKTPKQGLVLGTGLGGLAEQIKTEAIIPYGEIPHFPESTVESHAGQLVCGTLQGVPIVAMEGRFHYYEGYSMQQVTFPVRVMKALGVEAMIITNAAGGMNPEYQLGDIMLIEDHICFMDDNPLRGVNDDRLGPRYPDMFAPYDHKMITVAEQTAHELSISTHQGVLVAVSGPNLETRAEYRMLRYLGADCVTMSTVPEVIVAVHAGIRVLGMSVVTDLCTPEALEPVDIEKILEVAALGGEKLARLIPAVVEKVMI